MQDRLAAGQFTLARQEQGVAPLDLVRPGLISMDEAECPDQKNLDAMFGRLWGYGLADESSTSGRHQKAPLDELRRTDGGCGQYPLMKLEYLVLHVTIGITLDGTAGGVAGHVQPVEAPNQ
jgi:hypothetical protein